MNFNLGGALKGAAGGALNAYSSVLQNDMQQEWWKEQQAIQEERQMSLWNAQQDRLKADKETDPDVILDREAKQQQIEASKTGSAVALSGLSLREREMAQAAEDRKLSQANEARRIGIAEEQLGLAKTEASSKTYDLFNKETGEWITVDQTQLDSAKKSGFGYPSKVDVIKKTKEIETELNKTMAENEAKAAIAKVDTLMAEAKKMGVSEGDVAKLKLRLITGINDTKGTVTEDELFKAINTNFNSRTGQGEDRVEAFKNSVNDVFAVRDTVQQSKGGPTGGALAPPPPTPTGPEARTAPRIDVGRVAQEAINAKVTKEQILAKYPVAGPEILKEMERRNFMMASPEDSTKGPLSSMGNAIKRQFTIPPPPGSNR